METDIEIRQILDASEMAAATELEKVVWRCTDYKDVIPVHLFKSCSEAGGLMLGAYHGSEMTGFLLAFPPSLTDGIICQHSHIVGVHPDWMHKNIGYRLKLAHREEALKQQIKVITWTYDPVQGPNASVNIAKLGGISRKFHVDFYGLELAGSELVSGMPTDRFWVEWFIDSGRVASRLDSAGSEKKEHEFQDAALVNTCSWDEQGVQRMTGVNPDADLPKVFVEIPADFQGIADNDPAAALDWKLKIREIFLLYFGKGYTVTDFIRKQEGEYRRNLYQLEKDFAIS